MTNRFWAGAFAFLLCGCALTQRPTQTHIAQPPTEVPVSSAAVHARVPIQALQDRLNQQIPDDYADSQTETVWAKVGGAKTKVCVYDWSVRVRRTPFRISPLTDGLAITSTYTLWARAQGTRKACKGVRITTKPEGEMTLTLNFRPTIDGLYTVHPRVSYNSWNWTVRPGIKIAKYISVSLGTKVKEAIDKALVKAQAKAEQDIAQKLAFEQNMREAWANLHSPIQFGDDEWLSVKPLSLHVTPFASDASDAKIGVMLRSKNVFTLGSRPLPHDVVALPILQTNQIPDFFVLTAVAHLSYAEVVERAKSELVGRDMPMSWGSIRFYDVQAFQSGQRLVLGARVRISYRKFPYVTGWLWISGVPHMDGERLRLQALDYNASTNSLLVQMVGWLFKDEAKKEIESKLSFDLGPSLTRVKAAVNSLPAAPIGQTGELRLRVDTISVGGPIADAEELRVPVQATGKAEAMFFPYSPR